MPTFIRFVKLLSRLVRFYLTGRKVMSDAEKQLNPVLGYAEPLKPAVMEARVGQLTSGEALDFWSKHKNKAWVAILLVIGAVGGNVDELYKAIPDVHDVESLRKEVKQLRVDVDALRGTPSVFKPTVSDDGDFKVERPNK